MSKKKPVVETPPEPESREARLRKELQAEFEARVKRAHAEIAAVLERERLLLRARIEPVGGNDYNPTLGATIVLVPR